MFVFFAYVVHVTSSLLGPTTRGWGAYIPGSFIMLNDNNNNIQNILCDVVYDKENQLIVIDRYKTVSCKRANCRSQTAVGPYCVKHTAQMYRIKIQFPSPNDYIQRKHPSVFVLDDRYLGPKCYSQTSHSLIHPVDMSMQSETFKVESAVLRYFDENELKQWCDSKAPYPLPYRRPMYFVDGNEPVKTFVLFQRHWFGDFMRRSSDHRVANCVLVRFFLPGDDDGNDPPPVFKLVSLQTPGNVVEMQVDADGNVPNVIDIHVVDHAEPELIDSRNAGIGGDPRLKQYDELIVYDPHADWAMKESSEFDISRVRLSKEQLGLRDPVTGKRFGVVAGEGGIMGGGALTGLVWHAAK